MGIKETQQLNELLKQQAALYDQQKESLDGQLNVMKGLLEAVRNMNLETTARGLEQLNTAVKNTGKSVEELERGQQTMQRLNESAQEAGENVDELATSAQRFGEKMLKLAPVAATIEGIAAGLQFSTNVMSGLIGTTRSLIGSMFNLAASIISVPFKMLNGLMEMAAQGSGTELRQAIEDVRKEFGDLAQNEAQAIMKSWRQLDHFGGRLAETNISIWRTMGNMAETLKRVHEMATQLGPVFSSFTNEFAGPKAVERLHAYQKGLGLTEEGFRAMGEEASRRGRSLQEMGREITSIAYAMGESFGINGKLISREIGEMVKDFDHFGNIGVKELAQVAVYARKLGVEVEKLTGVLDQFADFDKAAESVAQLSQAFGIQLDTLKLVQEQDPAQNIERLRKAFFAAGRSIETMTRQERALLATHTGLDQKTLSLAFSAEKQGVAYQDIQKEGENAEKQQLSQAEAMQKLSNSIERLVKSGSQMRGGFFDIFLQGFQRGIRWTKEFWGLMWRLRRAMRATRWAGMRVGQMFVKHFPGVSDILSGIADLFEPRRWRKMLSGVTSAFRDFFQGMTKDPQTALPVLLEKLKETFFNWFDSSAPSGQKILGGFKNFFKALAHIFTGLLKQAIKGLTQSFNFITSLLKDPSKAIAGLGQAKDGVIGFLVDVFQPLISFFKSSEGQMMLKKLWESFVDMITEVWKKVQPYFVAAIPKLAALMFGPAFITGMIKGLLATMSAVFLKFATKFIKTDKFKKSGGILAKGLSKMTGAAAEAQAAGGAAGGAGAVSNVGATAAAARQADTATKGWGVKEASQLGLKLLAIAGAISIGAVAVAASVVAISKILEAGGITSIADAVMPLSIIAATVVAMLGVSAAVQMLQTVNWGAMGKALLGIVAVAALVEGMAFHFTHITDVLSGITVSDAKKVAIGIGAMTLAYAAAAGIVTIASLVGSIMSAGGGLGTLAVLAGLATIALVVEGAAQHTIHIMEMINNVRTDPGFKGKAEAFTEIIRTLGDFAGNIANIVGAAGPSFFGLLATAWGRDPQRETQRTIGMVVKLIDSMGEQVQALIDNIMKHIQNVSVEDLNKADKISNIIGAVTDLTSALIPPPELVDNLASDLGLAPNTIKAASDFVGKSATTIGMLIPQMIRMVGLINQLPNIDTERVKAVGTFLTGVGAMFKALLPSGATAGVLGAAQGVSTFSEMAAGAANDLSEQFNLGTRYEPRSDPAAQMINFLKTYSSSMMMLLAQFMPVVTTFMSSLSGIAMKIPPEKVEALTVVTDIFGKVVEVISSFTEVLSPENIKGITKGGATAASTLGASLSLFAKNIISVLQEQLPNIVDQVSNISKNMRAGDIRKLGELVPSISSIFGFVNNLTDTVDKLGKGGTSIAGGKEHFAARLGGIEQLLGTLFSDEKGSLIGAIQKVGSVRIPLHAKRNLEVLGGVMEAAGNLGNLLESGVVRNLSGGGDRVRGIHSFFGHLFNPNWSNGGNHWIRHIQEFGSVRIPGSVGKNIERVNSFVEGVSSIDFGMLEKQAKAAEQIDADLMERLQTGVSALIDSTNNVGRKLKGASSRAFNINSELQSFADNLGLKSTGRLEIAHQPIEFHVNWRITLDSEELEKALIEREGSAFANLRDRLK